MNILNKNGIKSYIYICSNNGKSECNNNSNNGLTKSSVNSVAIINYS